MMKLRVRSAGWQVAVAVTLLGILGTGATAEAAPGWDQIRNASGWNLLTTKSHDDAGQVSVYQTEVDGVDCFKGAARTTVSAEAMLSVIDDIAAVPKWSTAGVTEAKVLKRSGSTVEYYQYLDTPGWTFTSDRFWILRGNVQRGSSYTFTWDRMGDNGGSYSDLYKKASESAVEPPINVGGWVFTPRESDVEVGYYVCTDVGGSIPSAVQNAATKSTLPDTIGDLVREARRRTE